MRALDGVSFGVEEGEWIAIMGPSGSGKTTLINILGGLDTPTSGQALVDGTDVARLDEVGLTRFRAEKIGFIFQQFHLVPYLTALENVMLAQYFHSTTDETEAASGARTRRPGRSHRSSSLAAFRRRAAARRRGPRADQSSEVDSRGRAHRQPRRSKPGNRDSPSPRTPCRRPHHPDGHAQPSIGASPIAASISRMAASHPSPRFPEKRKSRWTTSSSKSGFAAKKASRPSSNASASAPARPSAHLARLKDLGLLEVRNSEVALTSRGETRARDIIRRRRLAERLFTDTFSIAESEAESHACKFEHIISPELDQRICTFLGHPKTCPHGNPIPAGRCCPSTR